MSTAMKTITTLDTKSTISTLTYLLVSKASQKDIITYMESSLQIAYNVGVTQGMIEALAKLRKELDMEEIDNG